MVKKHKRKNKKAENTSQAYRLVYTEDEKDFYFVPIDKYGNEMEDVPELNKDGSIRRTGEEKLLEKSLDFQKEADRMKQLFWLIHRDDDTPKPDMGVAPPVRKTFEEIMNEDHITISGFRNDKTDYGSKLMYKLWTESDVYEGLNIGDDDNCDENNDDNINREDQNRGRNIRNQDQSKSTLDKKKIQSITIAHEVMDADMHEALFGEGTEEFEEIGDDFMEHACKESEVIDEEFQQHLQQKILESARLLNFVPDFDNSDLIIEEIEEEEELDGEEFDLSDFEIENDDHINVCNSRKFDDQLPTEGKVKPSTFIIDAGKYSNPLDQEFDSIFEDYEEDSEVKENITEKECQDRNILSDHNVGDLVRDLSDFKPKISSKYRIQYGAKYKSKNPNELITEDLDEAFQLKDEDGNIIIPKLPENYETAWTVINDSADDDAILENMKRATPYLIREQKEEQWDCETIISTYTNTDNHPTVLDDGSLSDLRKNKRNKNRNKKNSSINILSSLPLHNIQESEYNDVGNKSDPDNFEVSIQRQKKTFEQKALPVITLSRKSGIPLLPKNKINQNEQLQGLTENEIDEEDLNSYESEAVDELASLFSVSTIRKKGESKEDKLARKEAAKDLKRIARQRKKLTKEEFNTEEQSLRQSVIRSKQGGTIEGSVFRYK